jgi:hypothetical protein
MNKILRKSGGFILYTCLVQTWTKSKDSMAVLNLIIPKTVWRFKLNQSQDNPVVLDLNKISTVKTVWQFQTWSVPRQSDGWLDQFLDSLAVSFTFQAQFWRRWSADGCKISQGITCRFVPPFCTLSYPPIPSSFPPSNPQSSKSIEEEYRKRRRCTSHF